MVQISSQDLITGLRKMDEAFDLKTGRIEQMMIDLRHKEVLPAIEEAEKAVKTVDKLVKESKVNKKSISNIQQAIEDAKIGANTAMARAQELLKDINHINDKWDAHDKELLELMNNLNSLTAEQRQQATDLMQKQQDLLKDVNAINDKWADSDRVIKEQRQRLDSWANELTSAKTSLQSLYDNLNDTAKELSALTDQAKKQGSTLILVQQNMDGIKQSVADVKGNVTSLSQRADLLQATVTDQAKSISQVSLKADGLSSQVSTLTDKTNQQAQSISQFNQTATSLQGQVASLTDASGKQAQQISEMKLDAEGVHTAVSELSDSVSVNLAKNNMPDWVNAVNGQTIERVPVKPNTQYSVSVDMQVTKPLANGAISTYFYECDSSNNRGTIRMTNLSGGVTTVQTEKLTFTTGATTTSLEVVWLRSSSMIEANIRHLMINEGATVKPYTSNTYSFKDMATFDQTAKSLTSTVATNLGDLATLKQTANELRSDITNANGDITTLKTRANGFDALIGTKASQADLNDTKKLINDNSLSITANKNALQLKADQTTVDRVKNQVDTVSAQQTIQANQIAQRVTQSTLTNTLNGYATQDYVSGQIKTSANAINLNVTALSNKVNDNRGGVNLLTAPTNYSWQTNNKFYDPINRTIPGSGGHKVVTVSFDLKSSAPVPIKAYWYAGDDSTTKTTTNYGTPTNTRDGQVVNIYAEPTVKRVVITWEYSDNSDKRLLLGRIDAGVSNGVMVYVENIMLEYGSVAHPYQLAPADQATTKQVTDLTVDLNGVKSTVATQGQAISEFNQRATGLEGRVADNKNNIDSLKITADGLRNQVGTMVSKADLADTTKKISDLSTLVNQTKNSVDIKANRTDVDRLKQSVTEYNAKLSVQADQITNLVTKSELTTATNGLATQNWVQTQVAQQANQWNLNITNLETRTKESLAGAGINLTPYTSDQWKTTAGNSYMVDYFRAFPVNPGETYTFSVEYRNFNHGSGTDWGIQVWTGTETGRKSPIVAAKYSGGSSGKITLTVTVPANEYYLAPNLNFSNGNQTGASVEWRCFKSERGSIATPYTPAPSDMATVKSVTDLTATVDGIKGTVQSKADKSEVTQLSNAIQQKVSNADYNSKISQLANDINARVTKGDVIGQINLTAGRTLIQNGTIVLKGNTIADGGLNADLLNAGKINTDQVSIGDGAGNNLIFKGGMIYAASNKSDVANRMAMTSSAMRWTVDSGQFLQQTIIKTKNRFNIEEAHLVISDTTTMPNKLEIFQDGVAVGPSLFFTDGKNVQDDSPVNGGWAGFTRAIPNNGAVVFNTANNNAEMFRVASGARFNNYVYFDKEVRTGGVLYADGKITINGNSITSNTWWSDGNSDFFAVGTLRTNGYTSVLAKSFQQSSRLSRKTNLQKLTIDEVMPKLKEVDMYSYQYKVDVEQGKTKRYASLIIDDVNEVSQYNAPKEFLADNDLAREDGSLVAYLTVGYQDAIKRIEELEQEVKELKNG